MELSDMVVLREVARRGSITGAAKTLHRVPSNITARIQKLERELGKPLFLRDKNRLKISPAGRQFLLHVEKILKLSEHAVNEFQDDSPRGLLNVGAMEAVTATRLVGPLVRFHKDYAEVELNIKTAPTGDLITQVLAGTIDIAFVADPPADSRLVIKRVFQESLVLVSDLNHKSIRKPQDLGPEPSILGFNPSCAYRGRLNNWVSQGGVQPRVTEINSYHGLLSCVAAGMGVGIVPEILLSQYPFRAQIQTHALPAKVRKTSTAMIWRADSVQSSMEVFAACVEDSEALLA